MCGAYPYQQGDLLSFLVAVTKAKKILELGTGVGYSSAVMASVDTAIEIETIDQDKSHVDLARKNWQQLGLERQITTFVDKAEVVLPELTGPYDLIFFDGYSPSLKFIVQFGRLLKKEGLLITANMFLKDQLGGKYMRALQKTSRWQTMSVGDTTVALKLF